MKVIYEPKGRAKEYADLAFNSYIGCPHACKYCFAPSVMRSDRDKYHTQAKPRPKAIYDSFEKDCIELEHKCDTRRVHMNFVSDPYPAIEKDLCLTRYCIETAYNHKVGINILTKGKYEIVKRDFDLFKEAGVHLGVTLSLCNENSRQEWEPNASTIDDRFKIITEAHNLGIYTWVSMEPVIYPDEALKVIDAIYPWVDLWKVGRLNYNEQAKKVNWVKFRDDVMSKLKAVDADFIIKKDLQEAK